MGPWSDPYLTIDDHSTHLYLIPPPLQHFLATSIHLPLTESLTAAPGSSVHWLLIPFWIKYKFWCSPINASISTQTCLFRELSTPQSSTFILKSTGSLLLHVPGTNWGICSTVPHLWDSLPIHPRASESLDSFKVELKPFSIQNGLWLLIKHNKIAISANLDEKCNTNKMYYYFLLNFLLILSCVANDSSRVFVNAVGISCMIFHLWYENLRSVLAFPFFLLFKSHCLFL